MGGNVIWGKIYENYESSRKDKLKEHENKIHTGKKTISKDGSKIIKSKRRSISKRKRKSISKRNRKSI